VLIQAMALGDLTSLPALRSCVRNSFALRSFEPLEAQGWQDAYQRFGELNLPT